MSFNSSPERGGKAVNDCFHNQKTDCADMRKKYKEQPGGLCLSHSIHYVTASFSTKMEVFSLAQSQMWEVQWKADKVNTSLFSFHAYLYRNSLLQNRSFFHPLCFWMKPRTRSMASVEPLLGGLVGWLAFVLMCFFITLQDYLKQLFSKHTCFLSHVSPVHLQIQ